MKKLFLASIVTKKMDELLKFLPDSPKNLSVAFVTTAADPYEDKWFVDEERDELKKCGFKVRDFDIKGKNKKELLENLKNIGVLFVVGGNVFYLLEKVKESGFDEVVGRLVEEGVVYVGSSAGAVLACPDIQPLARLDDPSKAPNLKSTEAMSLVDFVVLPHYKNEKYMGKSEKIIEEFKNYKHKLIPITDEQAIVVEGNKYKIV